MTMKSHRVHASAALITALFVAAIIQLLLIHLATLNELGVSLFAQFWQTLLQTFAYGLPLGIAAVLATEFLRLRRPNIQIAIGTALTFIAAHFATRGEPLTSYVFMGGALTALGLLASGMAASATYWAMAGRRAGWRGDKIEKEYEHRRGGLSPVERAGENRALPPMPAHLGRCQRNGIRAICLAHDWLKWPQRIASVHSEREGQSALTTSGYAWATFKISDGRGAIEGIAPDELEKRTAYDIAREALTAVTGVPGVVSRIDDKAVAQLPMAAVNQKLADAKYREQQANQAIDEARRVAEAARTAEADAKWRAEEQAMAADAERKKSIEQQQSEQVLEQSAEQVEVQKQAAEALAKTFDVEPVNTVEARRGGSGSQC